MAAPQPAAPPPPVAPPIAIFSSQGSWEATAGKYQLKLKDERDKTVAMEGIATEEVLTLTGGKIALIFERAI